MAFWGSRKEPEKELPPVRYPTYKDMEKALTVHARALAHNVLKAVPGVPGGNYFQEYVYRYFQGDVAVPFNGHELLALTLGLLNNPYFVSGQIKTTNFFPQESVQEFIIQYLAMPEHLMLDWAKNGSRNITRHLAAREDIPGSVISVLGQQTDKRVRGFLLYNPTVPEENKVMIGLTDGEADWSDYKAYTGFDNRAAAFTGWSPYSPITRNWDVLYYKVLEPQPGKKINRLYES